MLNYLYILFIRETYFHVCLKLHGGICQLCIVYYCTKQAQKCAYVHKIEVSIKCNFKVLRSMTEGQLQSTPKLPSASY